MLKLVEFYRQFKKKAGKKAFPKNRRVVSKRKGDRRFRTILGNMGVGSIFQNIGGDTEERVLGNAEMGGVNDFLMWDLVGAVSGDLLEINEASGKEGKVQMVKFRGESGRNKEEKNILTALALMGEVISDQCHIKWKEITIRT